MGCGASKSGMATVASPVNPESPTTIMKTEESTLKKAPTIRLDNHATPPVHSDCEKSLSPKLNGVHVMKLLKTPVNSPSRTDTCKLFSLPMVHSSMTDNYVPSPTRIQFPHFKPQDRKNMTNLTRNPALLKGWLDTTVGVSIRQPTDTPTLEALMTLQLHRALKSFNFTPYSARNILHGTNPTQWELDAKFPNSYFRDEKFAHLLSAQKLDLHLPLSIPLDAYFASAPSAFTVFALVGQTIPTSASNGAHSGSSNGGNVSTSQSDLPTLDICHTWDHLQSKSSAHDGSVVGQMQRRTHVDMAGDSIDLLAQTANGIASNFDGVLRLPAVVSGSNLRLGWVGLGRVVVHPPASEPGPELEQDLDEDDFHLRSYIKVRSAVQGAGRDAAVYSGLYFGGTVVVPETETANLSKFDETWAECMQGKSPVVSTPLNLPSSWEAARQQVTSHARATSIPTSGTALTAHMKSLEANLATAMMENLMPGKFAGNSTGAENGFGAGNLSPQAVDTLDAVERLMAAGLKEEAEGGEANAQEAEEDELAGGASVDPFSLLL